MAVLDSIAIETQATIGGVLILVIITLLEIIDLQRARKLHHQELRAISSGIIPARRRLVPMFSLILQFIFGFAAFGLFVCWMMYLIIIEKTELAVVAGVSAFVGGIMPFVTWSFCRKAKQETACAIRDAESPVRHETPVVQAASVQVVDKAVSIQDEPIVKEAVSGDKPRPAAVTKPEVKVEVKPAVFPKSDPTHGFPQDSMLRRHFITHLAARVKHYVPTRPTDSMLIRHYDSMMAGRGVAASVAKPVEAHVSDMAKASSRKCTHIVKLPEDSMLRRHFLTALRVKIESRLSFPARPTDSMLRRHFDTLKENLLAAELNKYLQG
jgi:hypothetical protein